MNCIISLFRRFVEALGIEGAESRQFQQCTIYSDSLKQEARYLIVIFSAFFIYFLSCCMFEEVFDTCFSGFHSFPGSIST